MPHILEVNLCLNFKKKYSLLVLKKKLSLTKCDEEENLLRETWSRKRREENIPDDAFVHFDIPLTKEHEAELLKKVGFTVTVENGNDCLIIKAVK